MPAKKTETAPAKTAKAPKAPKAEKAEKAPKVTKAPKAKAAPIAEIEEPTKPDGLKLAKLCRDFAEDKKALDPIILDLREISSVADYFVICSADSEPQLKAIGNGLEKTLKDDHGVRPLAVDGYPASQWIVVHYGDVMVHIFHKSTRPRYNLEGLWRDAPVVK